ncbi:universal stress protein [Gilvimarinus agarilyticus]|uniref:universal stress protein n=1 Tax=unclassified Gilvimarinus TaxID=2642066 RepID=UPI001C0A409E|nr:MULTISPECIES: universal stress protein [unclassified Gilvimarinus]MBU2885125.1 universal stress protein [Gilvimarinus agarilyticus]MDO6570023.1 universal stress protein [Gilvimarinus sp. 2_MG-2023]MDO6747290.1 universal stress protein [Gilvimarinus sp. 1_MG-2023]
MDSYKHILVGLDLTGECPDILQKAVALAQCCGADVSVAHVIEPLTFAYGGDMPVDLSEIQDQLQLKAEQELIRLVKQVDCKIEQQHILVGQPATELHNLAQQLGADLIAVGSHGRKGFALLLGSTSNSVLHGANRDVLAIRVSPTMPE